MLGVGNYLEGAVLICILEPDATEGVLPVYHFAFYVLLDAPPCQDCATDATTYDCDLGVIFVHYAIPQLFFLHYHTFYAQNYVSSFKLEVYRPGNLQAISDMTLPGSDRRQFETVAWVRLQSQASQGMPFFSSYECILCLLHPKSNIKSQQAILHHDIALLNAVLLRMI